MYTQLLVYNMINSALKFSVDNNSVCKQPAAKSVCTARFCGYNTKRLLIDVYMHVDPGEMVHGYMSYD